MPSHYIPISKLCFAVEKEDIFFLPIMKVESYFYTVSFIYTFFTKIFLYHLSNLPLFFITFVSIKRSNCLFRDIYGKNINTMTIYFGKHFWNIIIIESFLNRRLACEENFVSTNLLYSQFHINLTYYTSINNTVKSYSVEVKNLMEKRRRLECSGTNKIEFVEISKLKRKMIGRGTEL